jgi:radical SAM-linked protein
MTFALPLALGIEGQSESVDLRFTELIDYKEVTQRLNAVMPQGISVNKTDEPVYKASEIVKARYEVSKTDNVGLTELCEYFSRPEIIITKKTKRFVKEIDVKPLLEWQPSTNTLTLPAGNEFNINPWNVLGNVFESSGGSVEVTHVSRTQIICKNGEVFI